MRTERTRSDQARRRMDRRESLIQTLLGLMGAGIAGAGLVWVVHAAGNGRLTIGDVPMFVAALAAVQGGLAGLVADVTTTHHNLLLFTYYQAVVHAGPDLPASDRPTSPPPLRVGIELDNVWFRYDDDRPWVLRGITLTIAHGETLALGGANGAGKSTLVKLLCRFYDPTRGTIRWDGVDLRDISAAELRQRIGATFQDYMHYDLTDAENNTVRVGMTLSGGQWQRLALARAFLRNRCDLLILDEPSAGLDPDAEAEIHHAMREHRTGRTTLLITHRLGAVRDADLIVVLRDGQVAETGRHDELITADTHYARMFTRQASGYREPDPARPQGAE